MRDYDEVLRRNKAFINMEPVDRPFLGIHVGSEMPLEMKNAGKDKLYLLKSDTRNIDFGTPENVYNELKKLRNLHEEFPGIIMYRGGSEKEENVQAFERYYRELLVYE